MRHGANIPDIRALSASLSSLNLSINRAFPDTQKYSGIQGFRFNQRSRIADLFVQRITLFNPSPSTIAVGTYATQQTHIAPGDAVTFELGGGQELWGRPVDGVGSLSYVAEINLSGSIDATVGAATILPGLDFLTGLFFFGARAYVANVITDGAITSIRDSGLTFDYDINTDEGIDFRLLGRDFARSGSWILGVDENTNDLYTVNVAEETAVNLVTLAGSDDLFNRVLPIKTPVFTGYAVSLEETTGDLYLYDINGAEVYQQTGTGLSLVNEGGLLSSQYLAYPDSDTGEAFVLDLSTLTVRSAGNIPVNLVTEEGIISKESTATIPYLYPFDTLEQTLLPLQLGVEQSMFVGITPAGVGLLDDIGATNYLYAWDSGDYAPSDFADNTFTLGPDASRAKDLPFGSSILSVNDFVTGQLIAEIDLETTDGNANRAFFSPYSDFFVYQDSTTNEIYVRTVSVEWDPIGNL